MWHNRMQKHITVSRACWSSTGNNRVLKKSSYCTHNMYRIRSSGITHADKIFHVCVQMYLNKSKQLVFLKETLLPLCCKLLLNYARGLINAYLVVQVLVHLQVQAQFKVHLVLQQLGGWCMTVFIIKMTDIYPRLVLLCSGDKVKSGCLSPLYRI